MGQLTVDGTLTAGPASSGDGTFPAASVDLPLRLRTSPKQFLVATGVISRQLASPSAYVALEVGTGMAVTRADFVYLRSSGAITVRITTDDGIGGDVPAVVPLDGLFQQEFPSTYYCKLLEVKGTATIEYFASGQQ